MFLLRLCLQNLHLLGATAIEDKLQDVSSIFSHFDRKLLYVIKK